MNAFFGRFLSIVLLAVSPKHENQRHLKQLEYEQKKTTFAYVTVSKRRGNKWEKICLSDRAKTWWRVYDIMHWHLACVILKMRPLRRFSLIYSVLRGPEWSSWWMKGWKQTLVRLCQSNAYQGRLQKQHTSCLTLFLFWQCACVM